MFPEGFPQLTPQESLLGRLEPTAPRLTVRLERALRRLWGAFGDKRFRKRFPVRSRRTVTEVADGGQLSDPLNFRPVNKRISTRFVGRRPDVRFLDSFLSNLCVWQECPESATLFTRVSSPGIGSMDAP